MVYFVSEVQVEYEWLQIEFKQLVPFFPVVSFSTDLETFLKRSIPKHVQASEYAALIDEASLKQVLFREVANAVIQVFVTNTPDWSPHGLASERKLGLQPEDVTCTIEMAQEEAG